MTSWLDKLEPRGNAAARFGALFGLVLLVGLVVMTIFDVIMRWLFNSPINYIADVAPLVFAIVVSAFFPFAIAERYHVRIEFLGGMLSRRARAWLEVFVAFVTLIFFALVAWQIILYTIDLRVMGQTTWVVQIPSAPWWAVASFFMVLCVVVQFGICLTQISRAIKWDTADGDGPAAPLKSSLSEM